MLQQLPNSFLYVSVWLPQEIDIIEIFFFFTKLLFSLWRNGEIFELWETTYSQTCKQHRRYSTCCLPAAADPGACLESHEEHEKVCKTFIVSKPNCCPLPYHLSNNSHFPRLLLFNIPILHPETLPSLILSASCGYEDVWPWPAWAFELSFTYNADTSRNGSVCICVILYFKYLLKYSPPLLQDIFWLSRKEVMFLIFVSGKNTHITMKAAR